MAPARIAIGIARNLGSGATTKATAVVAIIPIAICPSAPMLLMPQREDTQIPRAMIVRGIILTSTSENVLKLEKGIDIMIEYVLNTLSPVARIIIAPTSRATSTAASITLTLNIILWLIFIVYSCHQYSKLFCGSFLCIHHLLVLAFEDYCDTV